MPDEPPAAAPETPAKPAETPAPAPAEKPPTKPKAADVDPFAHDGASGARLWTDATGQYRVEARFVSVVDGATVRLQKADGRFVRVAMDKLCAGDQQFVRGQLTALATAR